MCVVLQTNQWPRAPDGEKTKRAHAAPHPRANRADLRRTRPHLEPGQPRDIPVGRLGVGDKGPPPKVDQADHNWHLGAPPRVRARASHVREERPSQRPAEDQAAPYEDAPLVPRGHEARGARVGRGAKGDRLRHGRVQPRHKKEGAAQQHARLAHALGGTRGPAHRPSRAAGEARASRAVSARVGPSAA